MEAVCFRNEWFVWKQEADMVRNGLTRREFVGLTTAGIAGGAWGLDSAALARSETDGWAPEKPLVVTGKPLTVQPVLMYRIAEPRKAASWKSWSRVQNESAASEEVQRISEELKTLPGKAGFPLDIRPVVKVKSPAQVQEVHQGDYDIILVYAATGSGSLLRACFAPKKDKDTVIFVRHRSGPVYYWYEALSTRYLQTDIDPSQTSYLDHGGVHIDDVVVDDDQELLWRLRALYALKNFIGARIVALGGPWGKYAPEAPNVAQDKYQIEIIDVSYDDVTHRIETAKKDRELLEKAQAWTKRYLALPNTTLDTDRKFVVNAFVLYDVFKKLMIEHNAPAFTIKDCMTRILPMAETTPCLTLGLLNDEGLMAFCESDFVVIPAGILLHYISGKPVFMHNSTFPHNAICTCAHCSAPRRMNGQRYEPVKIMTHYESEYGAAPKVEVPPGQPVTFIDPQYSSNRWVGFEGIVKDNPLYEVCRSQQDVEIMGNWQKLRKEVRDSHWMMAYGNYRKEIGYVARKIGIDWVDISGEQTDIA